MTSPRPLAPLSPPSPLSAIHVARFRTAVRRHLGLSFDEGKLGFLAEVLGRRIDQTGQPAASYLTGVEASRAGRAGIDERRSLARELTVGETYFFRNIDQFHALRQIVLPERARAQSERRRLRLLSAGCASGEEPYSLAIVARELPELVGYDVAIRAVDVNPAMLERAAAGRYSNWSFRETPEELRARYFRADGTGFVLDPGVRSAVTFEERNLAEADAELWQPGSYDVIFCRNVLMYFAPQTARKVVARLARSLVSGGYLFLGSAETMRDLSEEFAVCHTHGTFYYRRGDAQNDVDSAPPVEVGPVAPDADSWVQAIGRASERIRSLTVPAPEESEGRDRDRSEPPVAPRSENRRPSAELDRAMELIRLERFSEAKSWLALLPTESASHPEVLLLRAVLHTHGGDLIAAERLCDELLLIDERSAGAHHVIALCRAGAGDDRRAAEHDRAAASLDPGFAMPRLHLGLLARRAGDSARARRELVEALALLEREDPSRVLLFGGGFGREGLLSLCRAELLACGGPS